MLEEDEAELELQKQLEKGRRLRQLQQLQQLRDSGEKVRRPQRLRAGQACAGLCRARACGDGRVFGDLSSGARHPHSRLGGLPCLMWCCEQISSS